MSTLLDLAREALTAIPGVIEGPSIFAQDDSEPGFWVDGKQMANFIGDAQLELRLTRKVISAHRQRLKADPRVILRGSSDWVGVSLSSEADIDLVRELGELAAAVYMPASGELRPPPSGAELERRRRFH